MLYSVPSFVAALLLLNLFYVRLEGTMFQLPLGGLMSMNYDELSFNGKIWDRFIHMILPVFCATYGSLAYYSRFVKSNMEEVIRQDYIRTARAKGVGPVRLIWHHAFRNSLLPLITVAAFIIPGLIGGSIIVEVIFGINGMGKLMYESILFKDQEVVMGATLISGVLSLVAYLFADLLYAVADPRVVYD